MFDTHCHLNFKTFEKNFDEVIKKAMDVGVEKILIPGTNLETSKKAVGIAQKYDGVYAAVGIHPHHLFEPSNLSSSSLPAGRQGLTGGSINNTAWIPDQVRDDTRHNQLKFVEELISENKVIAVGEVGLDKYVYKKTKCKDYIVDENFYKIQKKYFIEQIKLAIKHKKSFIIHNRQATEDLLKILNNYWDKYFEYRAVFHCCEANSALLKFAKEKNIFIGVDGDVTYDKEKADFIKEVPLELLVLETDSPFLTPEPIRSTVPYPNVPANLKMVARFVTGLKDINVDRLKKIMDENSKRLFCIN